MSFPAIPDAPRLARARRPSKLNSCGSASWSPRWRLERHTCSTKTMPTGRRAAFSVSVSLGAPGTPWGLIVLHSEPSKEVQPAEAFHFLDALLHVPWEAEMGVLLLHFSRNLGTIHCSNLCTEIIQYTSPDEALILQNQEPQCHSQLTATLTPSKTPIAPLLEYKELSELQSCTKLLWILFRNISSGLKLSAVLIESTVLTPREQRAQNITEVAVCNLASIALSAFAKGGEHPSFDFSRLYEVTKVRLPCFWGLTPQAKFRRAASSRFLGMCVLCSKALTTSCFNITGGNEESEQGHVFSLTWAFPPGSMQLCQRCRSMSHQFFPCLISMMPEWMCRTLCCDWICRSCIPPYSWYG